MPRPPKPAPDSTPKPRPPRRKSGQPAPPPAETAGGTPQTRGGFAEAPQAPFLPAAPSTLPALRQVGPPSRSIESMTASLNAILAKPHERSERAKQVLAEQPMIAAHPLVSGSLPQFIPHRPPRPEKSEGGVAFKLVSEYEPKGDQPTAIAELVEGVNALERAATAIQSYTTDGGVFQEGSQSATVVCGPGHAPLRAPDEWVSTREYVQSTAIYVRTALETSGRSRDEMAAAYPSVPAAPRARRTLSSRVEGPTRRTGSRTRRAALP